MVYKPHGVSDMGETVVQQYLEYLKLPIEDEKGSENATLVDIHWGQPMPPRLKTVENPWFERELISSQKASGRKSTLTPLALQGKVPLE